MTEYPMIMVIRKSIIAMTVSSNLSSSHFKTFPC
jgi:hypothetical protein